MTRSSVNAIMLPNAMFRLPSLFLCLLVPHLMRHLAFLCSLLPNLIRVLFYKKVLFLKIPFLCISLIPSLQKTNDEPRTNQGTPKELPTLKKCFLLILTTSSLLCPLPPQSHWSIPCTRLCSLPPASHAGISRPSLFLTPESHSGILASPPYTLHFTSKIFAHLPNFHYLCTIFKYPTTHDTLPPRK